MATSMLSNDKSSFSDSLKYHLIHEKRKMFYLKTLENYIDQSETKNITVVDFGTCDGGNIIPTFNHFIQFLQLNGPEKEITFVFNDQCDNDFRPLMQNIKDNKEFQSYDNVHILLNVGNVYKRCLPSCSIDIGFCMFVLNYLSRPIPIKNGLFVTDCTEPEYKEIRWQAEQDWKHFLLSRYSELNTGGILIVILPFYKMYGNEKQDSAYHKLTYIFRQMLGDNVITQISHYLLNSESDPLTAVYRIAKRGLCQSKEYCRLFCCGLAVLGCIVVLVSGEFERTYIPIFSELSAEDIKKPFLHGDVPGIEVCDLTLRKLYFVDVCAKKSDIAVFFKSSMLNSIKNGFDRNREEDKKIEICDLLFSRFNSLYPEIRQELNVDNFEITIRKHLNE